MVLLATRRAGTVSVAARHARRSVKRFAGGLEMFTLLAASLERKGREGPWQLAGTRVKIFHEGFCRDVGRLAAGSYAVELYRMLVAEEVVEAAVFDWLAGFFARWEHEMPSPLEMAREELALLALLGHAPRFDRCVTCGKEAPARAWARFDPPAGGIVCRRCGGEGPALGSRLRGLLMEATRWGPDRGEDGEGLGALAPAEAARVRQCMDGYIRALADREPRSLSELERCWGLS
jgi:DNA repair protein RecO